MHPRIGMLYLAQLEGQTHRNSNTRQRRDLDGRSASSGARSATDAVRRKAAIAAVIVAAVLLVVLIVI